MKILFSTLVATIAFFVQFGELNTSGDCRTPGPLTPNVVPEANPRDGLDDHRPPDERVLHADTYISLWLDPRNRRKVVRADFATNIVPSPQFVASNNFYVRLIYVGNPSRNLVVVGYFWPSNVIFGVRAPNPYAYARSFLEPTTSQWFIIHFGRAYKVKTNPYNSEVETVSLVPENLHEKPEHQHGLKRGVVGMGGVKFWIYETPNIGPVGAEYCPILPRIGYNPH